jgi:signal transduction histidine kinase
MSLQAAAVRVINDNHRFTYAQIGPDFIIVESSDNFSNWLPDGIESAENRPLSEIFPEFTGFEEKLTAVHNQDQLEFIFRYARRKQADDTPQFLNLRVVPFDLERSPGSLLLIVEDVTTTARMGQQLVQYHTTLNQAQEHLATTEIKLEQADQLKSFLISWLAHDMRTPLAAIRGYAELLLRLMNTGQLAGNTAKANGFADNICSITDQMTWLINDIIDLNHANNKELAMNIESCDIHKVIQETLEMFESIIKLQNLTLLLELNPLGVSISADPQRMRQVTNNIIGHAIKSTPTGGEIAIRTKVENGAAILTVVDTGKGLTAEEGQKIFQPYFRTQEATSSNILGSGLGLHIVKLLVEAHNGRVTVTSEINKGTTYTVNLPLRI